MPRPPRPAFPQPTLISASVALKDLCERLAAEEFVTVDTEFMRERTYWPELCVVQLAGEHEVAVIDAQAPDIDLTPLGRLLADDRVLKVFHAARQDIEIFVLRFGDVPRPLFDTQIAAMVAGFGEQVGYDALVSALAGGSIDKAHRFSDWTAVSLTDRLCRRRCHVSPQCIHATLCAVAAGRQARLGGRGNGGAQRSCIVSSRS
jgi:ribonuclease D